MNDYWVGMPEFIQIKQKPFAEVKALIDNDYIIVRFENISYFNDFISLGAYFDGKNFIFRSREQLANLSSQKITEKTKSIWFPFRSHWGGVKHKYKSSLEIKNRYPVYIVSKNRWSNGLTTKALFEMGVSHYIVVEKDQYHEYASVKNEFAEIIVLPDCYLDDYETCDDLAESKSKGPGAARNFCIDHSLSNGFRRHWVMDDNIDAFHYLNRNEKLEVECAATLAACEDFTERFSNVPLSGMNYYSFCKKTDSVPPFVANTRIYSCLLLDNKSGYRWRARYNEDTDLSLRILKDGLCTIQFNAFLCGKVTTQRMSGGNTKEFYSNEGTLPKSKMIEMLHPDCARVVWKFNRWHHHVDYSRFKENKLNYIGGEHKEYGLFKVSKER